MTVPHLVALVTGANQGIGFETARQLAAHGVHVLVSGRDAARVDAAVGALVDLGLPVTSLVLDVTDTDSVKRAAERVDAEFGRLDILVNNAAIRIEPYDTPPSEQPLDAWRTTFETNTFGVVATTQAFLPLLQRSPAARIVNVSSLLGSVGTHSGTDSYVYSDAFKSLPAYSASKSALNSWTVHLAYELRDTPIKVNAAHPGYSRTSMNDGDGDQSAADGARTSVTLALLPADGPTGTFTHVGASIPW
jgi:NAD(P)-dependent dehydrogenase (short-subunit alcohol dehydrogenase family)